MATYRKNVAVGATMIAALLCLGFMIILFGDAPVKFFRKAQTPVTLRAESAELVGGWGITFTWNDGHTTGIFSWALLRQWRARDGGTDS